MAQFFYPLWKWGGDIWNGGHIPLWNPDAAFGFPYLADPETLCWYPPKIIFYLALPAGLAFKFLDLFQYAWLLLGFWLMARHRGFSGWAVWAGSFAFGFSYETVALSSWSQSMFFTLSWVPWVFLAADKAWDGEKGGRLYLSLSGAMLMAAGYPVFAYLTVFSIFIERLVWVFLDFDGQKKFLPTRLGSLGLAGGLAFFFNMAWLLPFLEFMPLSNIGRRLDMSSSLRLDNLASWFNPFFGGSPLFNHQNAAFSASVYFMGLPTIVLLAWGCAKGKLKRGTFACLGLFLLLSLGKYAGVGAWLKFFMPGYHWVARSGYWVPFVGFFAALSLMEAAQNFFEVKRKNKWMGCWFFISASVIFLALALGVPIRLYSFWAGGFFLLIAGVVLFPTWVRGWFLGLAFVFSIAPVAEGIHFTLPQAFYNEKPPICSEINGPGRVYHLPDFIEAHQMLSGANMADVYQKFKGFLMPNWPLLYGLRESGFNNTLFLMEFLRWYYAPIEAPPVVERKFIDYLNTGFIIGAEKFPGVNPVDARGPVPVRADPAALPLWFTVTRVFPEGGWAHDFAAMGRATFDFRSDCFVRNPLTAGSYQNRRVRVSTYGVNHVELDAEGKGLAFLTSTELAYPGWRAKVDGRERSLEVVNHSFRGIILKPGERRVVLDYSPTSFRLGMFFSLLSVGIWSFLWMKFFSSEDKRHGRARI